MTKMKKSIFVALLVVVTGGFVVNYALSLPKISNEQINMLCSSCDSAIDGLAIKAKMTMTYEKTYFNNRQFARKERVESRNQSRNGQMIDRTYTPINSENDVDQVRDLDMITLGGKTQVIHNVHPSIEDETSWSYIDFFEPGKFYSISTRNKETGQQMVESEDRVGAPDSFNTMTAHSFGRGLSNFADFNKSLEADENDSNISYLKVFAEDEDSLFAVFTLDKSKGFCWTAVRFFTNGSVEAKIEASDFLQVDGVWIPYTITSYSFLKGYEEWAWRNKVEIQDASFLTGDKKIELNVSDIIPADAKIY